MTKTANTTFYRTGKGSHRHASQFCANSRRSVFTGEVTVIPAAEIKNWPACEHCCDTADVAASAQAEQVKADAMCPNTGVKRPGSRRLYDDCKDCGKNGRVMSNGTLKAHKPQH